ncbi:MAG: DUF397 domain-containing protein [Umezawaea sp.]
MGEWQKSSYSNPNGECVELAYLGAIRDSKNPAGPVLSVGRAGLDAFVAAVKAGHASNAPR